MQSRKRGLVLNLLCCSVLVAGSSWFGGCASMSSEGDEGGSGSSRSSSMPSIDGDYAADLPLHHVLWQRASSGGDAVTDAFMIDGTLFVVTESNWAHAIDGNGSHLWTAELGKKPDWRPAVSSSFVAFVGDGDLVVVSRAHGERKVKKRLSFTPCGPPAAGESAVYIPAWDGSRVYAVDPHSGEEGWRYRFTQPVLGRPTVLGDGSRQTLVAASEGNGVAGMDALAAGARPSGAIWSRETLGRNTAGVVGYESDFVLVASEDMNLYAMDRVTGQTVWAYPAGVALKESPAVSGGHVFQPTEDGLVALSVDNGEPQWTCEDASRFVTRDETRVLVLSRDGGTVHTLAADSGEVLESHDVSSFEFVVTNTMADGKLYLAQGDGEMIALDGQPLAQ